MAEGPHRTRCGVYPGTFDPVTNGHLDIVARSTRLLDRLVIGVAVSVGKAPIFEMDERVELVRAVGQRAQSAGGRERGACRRQGVRAAVIAEHGLARHVPRRALQHGVDQQAAAHVDRCADQKEDGRRDQRELDQRLT